MRVLFLLAIFIETTALGQPLYPNALRAYHSKVLSYNPIAYWPLNELTGTTAENFQGTAARNGTYTGVTLGDAEHVRLYTVPYFDGTNDYVNIFSTSLRDAFNGAEGTLIAHVIWAQSAIGEAAFRRASIVRADVNNRVSLHKGNTATNFTCLYVAGGTAETIQQNIADYACFRPMQVAVTWSKSADQVKFYTNGVQAGSTQTGLGTFAGSLADAWIGSDSGTPTIQWKGYIGYVSIFSSPLSAAAIADLNMSSGHSRLVRVGTLGTVQDYRRQLVHLIWSGHGPPTEGADSVTTGVTDPLASFSLSPSNLLRVDDLEIVMNAWSGDPFATNTVHVWYPTAGTSLNKAVLFITGHTGTDAAYNAGNQGQTVKQLVEAGFTVCGMFMPLYESTSLGTVGNHNAISSPNWHTNSLRYFLESPIRTINELSSEGFSEWFSTGLSGGGWTSHLLSAVDTRVGCSAPVASSLPLYMYTEDGRDWEQFLPGLWHFVDYTDLYVMASDDGREQLHILNTSDPEVFPQSMFNSYTDYTSAVENAATAAGGSYTLHWDTNTSHNFSTAARTLIVDTFTNFSR